MKIWLTITEAEDGTMTQKNYTGSEKEARAGVPEGANGEALFMDIATDKEGVLALANGTPKQLALEKAFDIKNGKWKSRT